MEIILIIIGVAILLAIVYLVYRLQNIGKGSDDSKAFEMMQNLMHDTKETNKEALRGINEVRREMHENLNQTTNAMQDRLQKIMRDLLDQMIPKGCYSLQYTFREGQTVDAIVKTKQGMIPIDSKFPLENFRRYAKAKDSEEKKRAHRDFIRDVKKHINDIAKKYILPQEGTVDFAMMYVPAETIWYELVRDDADLNSYANLKKVYLVSPNSFYYFLKVIMIGLEGTKIEEATKEILVTLKGIKQDSEKFGKGLSVLSRHVSNAKNMMDNVNNEYTRLSSKIDRVDMLEASPQSTKLKEKSEKEG